MEQIKFIDLKPKGQLANELTKAYDRVFNSGTYIGGKEVEAFEAEWAEYCEAKYCVGVGNGFDALVLACGYMAESYKPIKPGIHTPWKTCIPTWMAASTSCSPLPQPYKEKLKIAVHIYGRITLPDGYEKDYLIEDCAQAHGAKKDGVRAGKFGKIACWSFYPTKNLGALGDAGAITTDDEAVAEYARDLRNYGNRDDKGINSRPDPLQAAFLRVKLPHLDDWNAWRKENAMEYIFGINWGEVEFDALSLGDEPCWHIFAIETDKRDELKEFLNKYGIETMIHYPEVPYSTFWKVPEAERWTKKTLSLPIAPHVKPRDCAKIAGLINTWMEDR